MSFASSCSRGPAAGLVHLPWRLSVMPARLRCDSGVLFSLTTAAPAAPPAAAATATSSLPCLLYSSGLLLGLSERRSRVHRRRCGSLCSCQTPWARLYSTAGAAGSADAAPLQSPVRHRSRLHSTLALLLSASAAAAIGGLYYRDDAKFAFQALVRCSRVAAVAAQVAFDYKASMAKLSPPGPDAPKEEREGYVMNMSTIHTRNARRVLETIKLNGGVYIKLGQHLAALQYLLPIEWCETMTVLQDRCPPTPVEKIDGVFRSDLGVSLEDVFEDFDPDPIGVASLAQVHRARLRNGVQDVAVKIQHYNIDEYARIDIDVTATVMKIIKWAFPEFEFEWLAEEMQRNLPKELDFVVESNNAEKTKSLFGRSAQFGNNRVLHIPTIYWATKRILCMEFIDGARVDDLVYLQRHDIDPKKVGHELTRIFSEMIFLHGWVHCDPHPGNVMVRSKEVTPENPFNFELVLLDHGLYRELQPSFRRSYAQLWRAIMSRNEGAMKKYAVQVGGVDSYRLLSCILTGRVWDVVSGDLSQRRTEDEARKIHERAGAYIVQIADLLAKVPRELLFLFKTNDLLRSIDESLNTTHSSAHTFFIMGRFCAAAVLEEDEAELMTKYCDRPYSLWRLVDIARLYIRYWCTDVALAFACKLDEWRGSLAEWWLVGGFGLFRRGIMAGKRRPGHTEERAELVLSVADFLGHV